MTKSTPQLNATAARRLLENVDRDLRARLRVTKNDDPLDAMLRKAAHLLSVALIPSRSDGWPRTASGSGSEGGSGRFMLVPDERGDMVRVPTTSTEQAAMSGPGERDVVNDIARTVIADLASIQAALVSIDNALHRFENLRVVVEAESQRQCHVTRQVLKMAWEPEWEPWRKSDLGGLLDEPRDVCKWVYWFTRDNGRLPSRKEAETHLERNVVRVRA